MPFVRPTPTEILQRLQAEFDIALEGSDARVRRSVEFVLARVITMAAHEQFGYLEYISKQILVLTADEENLERHGTTWGIPRKAATAAFGIIKFTGTNGTVIPAGRILKRTDDFEYVLDDDVTISAGIGLGSVLCQSVGAAGNAATGTKINLTSPVAGVNSEAIVQAPGLLAGTDIESPDAWRLRILQRIQQPPHGGAAHDYIAWALSRPGVTRAWCYPEQYGDGTVGVSFVMDDKAGTIIPSGPEVAEVADYIATVRPVTADVTVFAPTAVPVNFEINLSPNTLAIQNAVKAELEDLFRREAQPGGTLYISRIRESISTAVGEFDHVLVSPSANIVSNFGDMPTLGSFTIGGV